MASPTRPAHRRPLSLVAAALATMLLASPAFALRVVDYNLLNYPGSSGAVRDPNFRTVLSALNADVIATEEQTSQAGVDEFLNNVLNTMDPPGTWGVMSFHNGNDSDAALYYRKATVDTIAHYSFYPSATNLRLVNVFRIRPKGYASDATELRIYTCHLKASQGFETDRLNECIGIRNDMNSMPAGTHAMICGDMNFYTTEVGYQKLLESQANNIGRVYDVLPAGTWHDGSGYASIHTQSTCLSGCLYGEASGGMDDRFDMILPTYNLGTGQGLAIVAGTMKAVGQDGNHFNKAITDSPTIPEGAAYAAALLGTSDHLPVRVDLQLPAKISTDGPLAFGTVIVGAPTQNQNLSVSNTASAPADSLNCTFSVSSPFGAPGPLAVAAANSAPAAITMSASTPGSPQDSLVISSDDPDHPTWKVGLSGTVLDHAQASLDSLAALLADTLDFGEHESGGFTPLLAAVHNRGWTSARARLSVNGAPISGGAGRFSIQGFTSGTLVSVPAGRWNVAFDDAGATLDSTYEATLTFQSADETLPGAQPQSDLVVTLRARVKSSLHAAKLATASQLDFGTVITGATAQQALAISNSGTPPADSLRYSFLAPAGFSAPPGTFAQAAGDPPTNQTIGMSTAGSGSKSGTLTVSSNDPDSSSKGVLLSGLVLDHAQVSLDSLLAVAQDTLDFGEQTGGGFTPLLAAVHNLGWTAQDARLSVNAAQITSGDGRFSIQGFTAGTLVAGTAARWSVVFDDAGATPDSTYEATLTFQSSDEELPGATAQPDVQYLLRARVRVTHAVTSVVPAVTRLYKPVPNPMLSGSTLRFDLAQGTSARLEVFDLSGRRVAVLADREFAPGTYSSRWNGRDDAGAPAGPGLYFVRLTGPGLRPQTVRLAIVR